VAVSLPAPSQRSALAGCYFFFFALLGLIVPYWGLFLSKQGFNSAQIGELLAVFMATRIVMPTLWAILADRSGERIQVVRLGSLCSLVLFLGFFYQGGYWWLALILGLFASFWSAILPQLEVITLASLGKNSQDYSKIRMWGSLGFIVIVTLAGVIFDHFGVQWIIPLGVGLLAMLVLTCFSITYCEPPEPPSQEISIWRLLKQPNILLFFTANLLLQISHGPYYNFFVLYLNDHGFSETTAGLQIALGVAAEIVIFGCCATLIRWFGAKQLLLLSMLLTVLRWALMPWVIDDIWWLSVTQLLHAASFGSAHAASMVFVHQWFKGKYRGRGQALYASVAFGIGGTIGALGAGYLWQQGLGSTQTWLFASAAAGLAFLAVCLIQLPAIKTSVTAPDGKS